jgi:hypothetical protein
MMRSKLILTVLVLGLTLEPRCPNLPALPFNLPWQFLDWITSVEQADLPPA